MENFDRDAERCTVSFHETMQITRVKVSYKKGNPSTASSSEDDQKSTQRNPRLSKIVLIFFAKHIKKSSEHCQKV